MAFNFFLTQQPLAKEGQNLGLRIAKAAKHPAEHGALPQIDFAPPLSQELARTLPTVPGAALTRAQGTPDSSVSVKTTQSSPTPLLPCLKTQQFTPLSEGMGHHLSYTVGDHPLPVPILPCSFTPRVHTLSVLVCTCFTELQPRH